MIHSYSYVCTCDAHDVVKLLNYILLGAIIIIKSEWLIDNFWIYGIVFFFYF